MIDELLTDLVDRIATRVTQQLTHRETLPVLWTVPDACKQMGIGKNTIYDLIARGEIDAIRTNPDVKGSRLLIVPESVIAWRDRQVAEQRSAAPGATTPTSAA
jgi:excisionase family DNA binding protein